MVSAIERDPRLEVEICGIKFHNPILTASGCCGYGLEFEPLFDLSRIGGICTKGLSARPLQGNPPPRIQETAAGMLNAIGLQNIGARAFVEKRLPRLRDAAVTLREERNRWGRVTVARDRARSCVACRLLFLPGQRPTPCTERSKGRGARSRAPGWRSSSES